MFIDLSALDFLIIDYKNLKPENMIKNIPII